MTQTETLIQTLTAMPTRDQAAAHLATVKGAALAALTQALGLTYLRTAAERRAAAVERLVGSRLNSRAIRAL